MQFTPEQDQALRAVDRWLRAGDKQVFRLFGYAGTGKTTLAKYIAEHVDGRVIFAAFTGKAAHVMRSKGCDGASTLHSLIYKCTEVYDEERRMLVPRFVLNVAGSALVGAKLLIVDECSMVDANLGADVLSFNIPVLVLGDPAQLPPIGGAGFFTNAPPDVMLVEVQRQAHDNPILHMAHTVREGGCLAPGNYGSSRAISRNAITLAEFATADQILVGRNKTRYWFNAQLRHRLGLQGIIEPADRLVCLRNNHARGLLNGSLWTVRRVLNHSNNVLLLDVVPDDDPDASHIVKTHSAFFRGAANLELSRFQQRELDQFDFGYALTVHKAQGSQWPNVAVFDESEISRQDARKWLYTAITRASDTVTVALP
jgi:exodeoxyribonuclease V